MQHNYYYQKYIKYKQKYHNLKQSVFLKGGDIDANIVMNENLHNNVTNTDNNLDIYDKRSYIIDNDKPVKLSDVRYIVDNLWLDHFIYESDDPIIVSNNEYNTIFLSLLSKYPDLLRNCRWGYRP